MASLISKGLSWDLIYIYIYVYDFDLPEVILNQSVYILYHKMIMSRELFSARAVVRKATQTEIRFSDLCLTYRLNYTHFFNCLYIRNMYFSERKGGRKALLQENSIPPVVVFVWWDLWDKGFLCRFLQFIYLFIHRRQHRLAVQYLPQLRTLLFFTTSPWQSGSSS